MKPIYVETSWWNLYGVKNIERRIEGTNSSRGSLIMLSWLRRKLFAQETAETAHRELSPFVELGFHGDEYLLRLVYRLVSDSQVFIETGANVGSTLAYVARTYPALRCLSCEPDSAAFAEASANTGEYDNVSLFSGVSQKFIDHLVAQKAEIFSKRALFWLDAHGHGFEWPLKTELSFITNNFQSGYILIDDFKVPGRDHFIFDVCQGQICSYDYVKDALSPERKYQLYYPTYSNRTSKHHPLCGWGLIIFGDSNFSIPDELMDKMERAL